MDMARLNTGAMMPVIGLGTWKSREGTAATAVRSALLDAGYRHIDGALVYRNEPEIGQVYKEVFGSGKVKREETFITSKLWNDSHARGDVAKACKQSLTDLNLDYLDLYLMHWGITDTGEDILDENGVLMTPKIPIRETWEAMQELVAAGLVKAIGISNFTAPMIVDLLSYATIVPAINQIELHPWLQQSKLVEFCNYKSIAVTAYSPLGSPGNYGNKGHIMDEPIIKDIAKTQNKTAGQVMLRWAVQRGTIAIPKSTHPERITENIAIFDFTLSDDEMARIATLDRGHRFVEPYEWWKIPYFG